MKPMVRHFVTFLSPGTFFCEETEKPIKSWNVEKACEMAHGIVERYNATPFAFYFTTRERKDNELDSREIKRSHRYYLGGELLTLEDVEIRNKNGEDLGILLSNMKINGWKYIIENRNSFRSTQPFEQGDTLLDWKPKKRVHHSTLSP